MGKGYLPPVLTNDLSVTVGGTLSMGGIGVASHRFGIQADNVDALEVVTGTGDLVTCSSDENQELFDAIRCGLGQFGVITRARLRLRNFSPNVRTFFLLYDNLESLMGDYQRILRDQRFDFIEGWCSPCLQGHRKLGGPGFPLPSGFIRCRSPLNMPTRLRPILWSAISTISARFTSKTLRFERSFGGWSHSSKSGGKAVPGGSLTPGWK